MPMPPGSPYFIYRQKIKKAMNDTYTIIKELQAKNKCKDKEIKDLTTKIAALCEQIEKDDSEYEYITNGLKWEIDRHKLAKEKAIGLLQNLHLKSKNLLKSGINQAIDLLET